MGMPMYGQTFTLDSDNESLQTLSMTQEATGLNAPASAGGDAGEYTRAKGFLSYYEVLTNGLNTRVDCYYLLRI